MKVTKIQWCDSTVNPIMGCGGCELYPKPRTILRDIDDRMLAANLLPWKQGDAETLFAGLLADAWAGLEAADSASKWHVNSVTTTNIYHLRKIAAECIRDAASERRPAGGDTPEGKRAGRQAAELVIDTINSNFTCYAARLHLNKAYSVVNPSRQANRGYAPTFEQVTPFSGRLEEAAGWSDLLGSPRLEQVSANKVAKAQSPWLDGLPRLIFLSDMGDALTRKSDWPFLKREFTAIESDNGKRHLWLWLTKRPDKMQEFAESIGGLPPNICAMTTVTSEKQLHRVDQLRGVRAQTRGLSIEPLWSPIADNLDLTGIAWVIVGGESGSKKIVSPFYLEWAIALRDLCRDRGVAFFCKQLGSAPA